MLLAVRPMQREDVAPACRILNEIIEIGGTTAYQTPFTDVLFAQTFLNGPGHLCCHVAADDSGAVAGFQWLGRQDRLPEDCADIATFARRNRPVKGVGRALFKATSQAARQLGFARINATIRADNVPGLSYYSKMGFRDHSVAFAMPLRDGTRVDRISKRFDLNGRD